VHVAQDGWYHVHMCACMHRVITEIDCHHAWADSPLNSIAHMHMHG
jgi:hypothetical protein